MTEEVKQEQHWVVMQGTPAFGFDLYGPFSTCKQAEDYLAYMWADSWVVEVKSPGPIAAEIREIEKD